MKPEKAHRILGAARPHGQDAQDPRMVEAEKALADHPELADQLRAERTMDQKIAHSLRGADVPEDLRASLMRSLADTDTQAAPPGRRRHWRPALAALAAVLVFGLLGLWQWNWQPRAEFARTTGFREAMAVYIAKVPFRLDFTSQRLGVIQQWLHDSELPTMPEIPSKLANRAPLGCKEIAWGETTVTLVCFYDSIPKGRIIHLFIAPRNALSNEAIGEIESTLVAEGFQTRGWQTEDWVCVLVPSARDMRVAPLLDEAAFITPTAHT